MNSDDLLQSIWRAEQELKRKGLRPTHVCLTHEDWVSLCRSNEFLNVAYTHNAYKDGYKLLGMQVVLTPHVKGFEVLTTGEQF